MLNSKQHYTKVDQGELESDESIIKQIRGQDDSTNPFIRLRQPRKLLSGFGFKALILHSSFLVMHLSIAALTLFWLSPRSGLLIPEEPAQRYFPQLIHSPANEVVQHMRHEYHSDAKSEYIRDPSPDMDEKWKDLLLGNFFRLSPDDLASLGRLEDDPVLLEDGDGVGLLNMHHEVHCVMGLWQAAHPEYYWPNATVEQQAANRHHVNHCLDYLMQAAMCHGDVGFMTYHWDMKKPAPYWKAAEHTCVDFEGIRGWLHERKVPIHDPGFLVHPNFGAPYPHGVQKIPTIMDDIVL